MSETKQSVLVEKDVAVPMRDGARLMADVFRPQSGDRVPAILNLGPYQKDKLWVVPPTLEEAPNDWMNWETANPEWWVPQGYGAVRIDGRGSGKSQGQCEPWSLAEAIDVSDAIEWAAAQRWCNGSVGLLGISYYAINQWFVAQLQPPSLKAIIPWEGFADIYRDALYHGGIFNLFMSNWFTAHLLHHTLGRASQDSPNAWAVNTLHHWLSHSLDSGAFLGAQGEWDKITVPLYSVGNWTGFGLHLRGNTKAFARAASRHKKLRIHTGSHVHPFYTEEARWEQKRFLDCFLKGIDNGVMDQPPIKLAIRHGADKFEWRHEREWPLARTQWTKMYFDLSAADGAGMLTTDKPAKPASRTYAASSLGTMGSTSASSSQVMGGGIKPRMGVSLETPPLSADLEMTGPLAASSTPYRPYHKHTRRLFLKPGEIVKVDVEIWPTSMIFKKGHRIRLDLQPRDGFCSQGYMHYHADYNTGTNTIHSGGAYESYLLLPVIPRS
jgi:predicted acyl esterase